MLFEFVLKHKCYFNFVLKHKCLLILCLSTNSELHYGQFDYYIYMQDNLYFRSDYLKSFVNGLPDPQEVAFLLSASPFRAHGQAVAPPTATSAERLEIARQRTNCSSAPQHI
jgi:hypothetical protein